MKPEILIDVYEMSAIEGQPPRHTTTIQGESLPSKGDQIVFVIKPDRYTAVVTTITHFIGNNRITASVLVVEKKPLAVLN